MTLKYLGMAVGFPEKSADVRLAQYETGERNPKADRRLRYWMSRPMHSLSRI